MEGMQTCMVSSGHLYWISFQGFRQPATAALSVSVATAADTATMPKTPDQERLSLQTVHNMLCKMAKEMEAIPKIENGMQMLIDIKDKMVWAAGMVEGLLEAKAEHEQVLIENTKFIHNQALKENRVLMVSGSVAEELQQQVQAAGGDYSKQDEAAAQVMAKATGLKPDQVVSAKAVRSNKAGEGKVVMRLDSERTARSLRDSTHVRVRPDRSYVDRKEAMIVWHLNQLALSSKRQELQGIKFGFQRGQVKVFGAGGQAAVYPYWRNHLSSLGSLLLASSRLLPEDLINMDADFVAMAAAKALSIKVGNGGPKRGIRDDTLTPAPPKRAAVDGAEEMDK